jgi:CRP-like cAMP-binding protein
MATRETLTEETLTALVQGNSEEALRCLDGLEALEPRAGGWPHKRGELLLQLGRTGEAVEALSRASDRYGRGGLAAKAIAVFKTILRVQPQHTDTQERLSELLAATESPTRVGTASLEPSASLEPPTSLEPSPFDANEPLIERTLVDLVPGSRVASGFESDEMPAVELAIDFDEPEPAGGFGEDVPSGVHALSAAARAAEQTLPRMPLFSSLAPAQVRLLIEGAELRRVAAGSIVFRQGESGHELYIIAAGQVAVMAPEEIARLSEGSFFGEVALLTDRGRTATVRACTNAELLAIPRPLFTRLIQRSPAVLKVLLRFVRGRLVSRLVDTSPLFAPFSGAERQALSGRFRFLELGARTTLVVQGRHAAGLFVLLAGEAAVVRDGRPLATLSSGDVFGELSLLTGQPATATVSTTTKSFVLYLPADEFREVVLRHPSVLGYLRDLSEGRLRAIGRLPVT